MTKRPLEDLAWMIIFAVVGVMLLLSLAGSAGCCKKPAPEVIVVPKPVGAIEKPPPEPRDWEALGPESGCPEEFAGCFRKKDLAALARTLSEFMDYAYEAWSVAGSNSVEEEEE